jgi:hypothetical protein
MSLNLRHRHGGDCRTITKNDPEQNEISVFMRQDQNYIKMILLGIKLCLNDIFWFKRYLNEIRSLSFALSHSAQVISAILTSNRGNQTGM